MASLTMPILLFDQNLSPRLISRLADLFPGAPHVSQIGLDRATDLAVWEYARTHDCALVTKDSDFNDLSVLRGVPPKVLWLRLGNCTTTDIEQTLRRGHDEIVAFFQDPALGVLELI
jgi:predicted nuclease of predicted toxin-antitoxin system